MKLLNGKELAALVKEDVKKRVTKLGSVVLVVVQIGDNAASSVYVRNKEKACEECGIESRIIKLPENVEEEKVLELINKLNEDEKVNGILVQLPLPEHLNEQKILQCISPEKDVDGFHVVNSGKLMIGEDTFVPCTAKGIIRLLEHNNVKIEGQNCVVVGRSNIVGKPVAMELLRKNGTVTICHSKTRGLDLICREADILICAIGKPKFFNRKYISPNTVVVDVGIHRQEEGTLCGDVDFEDVKDIVSAITPVPGGVGAMTVAMLMENLVEGIINMGKNFCIKLTNEEKREAIERYCDRRTSCYSCPLFNLPQEHGGCADCKVEYLDEHFRLISEMPDFFEELFKHDGCMDLDGDKMIINANKDACGKIYNIEWYLGSGKSQTTSTTSAILKNIDDRYFYFVYPSGGLFIVEQKAIRSLQCGE